MSYLVRLLILLVCAWMPLIAVDSKEPVFPPEPDDNTPFTEVLQSKYPQQEHFVAEFFNVVAVMGMVIVVMLAIAWLLKRVLAARMEQGNATSLIRVEDRRVLGPKSQVYLIEVNGTRIVIGETPAGLVRLGEIPPGKGGTFNPPTEFSKVLDTP